MVLTDEDGNAYTRRQLSMQVDALVADKTKLEKTSERHAKETQEQSK